MLLPDTRRLWRSKCDLKENGKLRKRKFRFLAFPVFIKFEIKMKLLNFIICPKIFLHKRTKIYSTCFWQTMNNSEFGRTSLQNFCFWKQITFIFSMPYKCTTCTNCILQVNVSTIVLGPWLGRQFHLEWFRNASKMYSD